MNYIKAQQEILADMVNETPRGVLYWHDAAHERTVLVPAAQTHAFIIPDKQIALDLKKCKKLEKGLPFPDVLPHAELEVKPTGVLIKNDMRVLMELKNQNGAAVYISKKLRDKFGPNVKFYTAGNARSVLTVAEETGEEFVIVGYLCPVNYKPNQN